MGLIPAGFVVDSQVHSGAQTRRDATTHRNPEAELLEQLGQSLGLAAMFERLLDGQARIERRLEELNITPEQLKMLEQTRAQLVKADETLDAIES